MAFQKIGYLEWARLYMGSVRNDLARSNVKTLSREELGFTVDHVDTGSVDECGQPALRKVIASRYGVAPSRVFVCNGATTGIYLACAALIDAGDEVLIETPVYEPLIKVPQQQGAEIKTIDRHFERNWQIDLEELERRVSRRTKAVLMTNLHNPTGTATNPDKMLTIGQIARDHGAKVICSEVYLDSVFTSGHKPAISYGDHLVSIGSLSKVYGLGGLRVGWIVATEDFIEKVKIAQDYCMGGISAASQSLATFALGKADALVDRCRQIVQGNLKILGEWVRKHPELKWLEPDGGTVALVKLPANTDAMALSNYLRDKHGTLVAPGDFFGCRGFIRIALGIEEETLRNGLKHVWPAIDHVRGNSR